MRGDVDPIRVVRLDVGLAYQVATPLSFLSWLVSKWSGRTSDSGAILGDLIPVPRRRRRRRGGRRGALVELFLSLSLRFAQTRLGPTSVS